MTDVEVHLRDIGVFGQTEMGNESLRAYLVVRVTYTAAFCFSWITWA